MTQTTVQQHGTYREVLAEPRFRLLFATRTAAITADALRITTLSVLVFATTRSPLLGALTFGVGFAPQLIGALLLGALADRARPRLLIVTGYLLSGAAAAVPALVRLPVAAVLALIAAVACVTPVFGAASTRLVAESLTGDAYVLGRALSNMSSSGAQLLGLAGGGIAVATLGTRGALLLSATGYLATATAVRLRLPDLPAPQRSAQSAKRSLLRHSWSGNLALFADRRVRALLWAQWLPSALVAGAESLIVPFAGQRGFPAGTAGILLGCLPTGMLIGDFTVGRFVRPPTRERLVAPLVALLGLPLVCFATEPGPALCAALLLLTGVGFAYGLGLQRRFLDALGPHGQGQAFGLLSSGLMTLQGVAPALFGLLADQARVGPAIACAGAATVVAALWLAASL